MASVRLERPQVLLDTFQGPAIIGRWLLVSAETIQTAILVAQHDISRAVLAILALLACYNTASLIVIHRVPLRRIRIWIIIALDLVGVVAASAFTGGSQSPFINECFLIIFAAALFYGVYGGTLTGIASAAITVGLIYLQPIPQWRAVETFVPYFLLSGVFSGYLVERLRASIEQYEESQEQAHELSMRDAALRRELELARTMQEAMLPSAPAQHPGVSIGSCWEFAQAVGGDFHFFLTEGNRLAVILGDVSGNGVPAALAATSIGLLLPRLHPVDDPGGALAELNADLLDSLPGDAFVTLVLAEFDPKAASLKVWNAGHPPPLFWSDRKQAVSLSESYNPLLGVIPDWSGNPDSCALDIGDVLVIYSDGLIEVRNEEREMFGAERAAAVLRANASKGPQAIANALLTAVNAWGTVIDDLTIVACKYTGMPASPADAHLNAAGVPPAW